MGNVMMPWMPAAYACRARHWGKVVVAAVAVASLAGCGGGLPGFDGDSAQYNTSTHEFSPARQHPIFVEPTSAIVTFPTEDRGEGLGRRLSSSEVQTIASFAESYRDRGHGRMTVSAPVGVPAEGRAAALAIGVREALLGGGVAPEQVDMVTYRPLSLPDGGGSPPVFASFQRYVASTPECGFFHENVSSTGRNLPYANYGCFDQNNLAAQLVDPYDLREYRGAGGVSTPPDTQRRVLVLDAYRSAQPTASARSDDESGAVSDAVGGR